jgi:hypothetical protein|tara:strand:- start:1202 stop:1489 length:288 start_codon:yes stop_codon:yes gene_type:complete
MKLLKVIPSANKVKKYDAIFLLDNKKEKKVSFGAKGYSDFTINKDDKRKEAYRSRHKKDLNTKDPMRPGFLSYYILWNKPTLKASIADYKRMFNF